jgi:periplasmic divalent cation tolerance protein
MRQAKIIQHALIKEKLAACVKIGPETKSMYRWKGKIERSDEIIMFIESRKANRNKIIKRIKHLHSYEIPAIVVLDVECGSKEFLRWVEKA